MCICPRSMNPCHETPNKFLEGFGKHHTYVSTCTRARTHTSHTHTVIEKREISSKDDNWDRSVHWLPEGASFQNQVQTEAERPGESLWSLEVQEGVGCTDSRESV